MSNACICDMKYCLACGKTSNDPAVRSLIRLPDGYICNNCVELMVKILANESGIDNTIIFVENIQQILENPIEKVKQWKEIKAKREE